MSITTDVLLSDALIEIGALGIGQTASGAQAAFVLGKLNRLLDQWNADRRAVYGQTFTTYTITPSLQPHTIGPTGATYTVTSRPVSIESASRVRSGIGIPLHIRTAEWWGGQTLKTLTGDPYDVYYEPAWPNGKLYFWPVPTVADSLELQARVLLAELASSDTFALPVGYREALTLTLAESIATPLGYAVPPILARNAEDARALIFANNVPTPRLSTRDAGMPGGGGSFFDYQTGMRF